MKLRKIGAFLAGTLLMGATLGGVITQEVPPDFFVDPETGEFDVIIVVGSEASDTDVELATTLATALGVEVHKNVGLLLANATIKPRTSLSDSLRKIGFPTVDVPDAYLYQEWEHNGTPISYTLRTLWYFDDPHGFWGNSNGHFDPWETHEEIQIRFDVKTLEPTPESDCVTCLHGGDIDFYGLFNEKSTTFKEWHPIPGVIYRADNIFAPPVLHVELEYEQPVGNSIFAFDFGPVTTLFMPEPWMVVQERLPRFKLFDTVYTVIGAGPVLDVDFLSGFPGSLHGMPYIITGEPHFEAPVYLYLNEPQDFSIYTVEVKDTEFDYNRVLLDVSIYGELIESFWMECYPLHFWISPTGEREWKKGFPPGTLRGEFPFAFYDTCEDLNGDGELDPGEITNIITYDYNGDGTPDYHKWVVGKAEKAIWADYTWYYYTDDRYVSRLLFSAVDFAIEGVKVFIGAEGISGVEIKVYWLENTKLWYNRLCSDPWATEPDYQLFLDVCELGWDEVNNTYVYQPPGTGLWPPLGLDTWIEKVGSNTFIGNGFLDSNDGHTGHEYTLLTNVAPGRYFPEQYDLDRDNSKTNDCRASYWSLRPMCTDMYDAEDPVIWHGPGVPMVELNVFLCENLCAPGYVDTWPVSGPICEDNPYFTIEVTDVCYCGVEDGIDYNTIVHVGETDLIMTDTEFDATEWESTGDSNLILIGGPVANIIDKQLVDDGMSSVNWTTSPGEWEYIPAPYGNCDILIVAGADRDATCKAVQSLLDYL